MQFASDGRLVSGGGDSTLRVWDVAAGKEVFQFKLHEPRAGEKPLQVTTMQVSEDGQRLAAAATGFEGPGGTDANYLFAWNLANGKIIARHEHTGSFANWPGFSADARAFLAHTDKGLLLKDMITGKERVRLQPVPQPSGEGVDNPDILQSPFTFSPDGRVVALRGSRQRHSGQRYWQDQYAVVLFDLSTGQEMYRIPADTWLAPATFSADSKRLAAAVGSDVGIWDTATSKRLWQSPALDTRVNSLAFSPDGRRLAAALGNTTILLWDVGSTK